MLELPDGPIKWDGFDECIIGVGSRCGFEDVLCYDINKMIELLEFRDGMSYEEAVEYLEYNVIGAYVGKQTPVIITPILGEI